MKIRGERRCKACGVRWSYFETGSVECPECGSIHSVSVDDPLEHTDRRVPLDLTDAKAAVETDSVRAAADEALDATTPYLRNHGFIEAGDLKPLDDTVLGAYELREVSRSIGRALEIDDDEQYYFLTLLRAVPDGDRPEPAAVPQSLRGARGLAIATAVKEYLRESTLWLDTQADPQRSESTRVIGRIRTHQRRIAALDGDVPPETGERLVRATRALATYATEHDPTSLETATAALDSLDHV